MIPPLTGNAPTAQRQPAASAQDGLEGSPPALSRSIGKAKAQDLSWISHSDASQPQLAGITAQQHQKNSTSNISRSDAYGLTHRWHRPIFLAHISEPISMGVNAHSYPVSPVFVRR